VVFGCPCGLLLGDQQVKGLWYRTAFYMQCTLFVSIVHLPSTMSHSNWDIEQAKTSRGECCGGRVDCKGPSQILVHAAPLITILLQIRERKHDYNLNAIHFPVFTLIMRGLPCHPKQCSISISIMTNNAAEWHKLKLNPNPPQLGHLGI
jgi:hypothetical protein